MRMHTTDSRDSAMDRLRNINRGVVVGCLVLTAVLAEAAAKAFPGEKGRSEDKYRGAGGAAPNPL